MRYMLVTGAALILLAGCAEDAPPPPPEPVVLGVLVEEVAAQQAESAAAMAQDQLTSAGGLLDGRPLQIKVIVPVDVEREVGALIEEDGASALVGPFNSTPMAFLSQQITAAAQVIQPTIFVTDVRLRAAQSDEDRYLFFFSRVPDALEATLATTLIAQGCTDLALVADTTSIDPIQEGLAAVYDADDTATLTPYRTSFTEPMDVTAAQAGGHGCLFLVGDRDETILWIRTWYSQPAAPDIRWVGSGNFTEEVLIAELGETASVLDGALVVTSRFADARRAEYRDFRAETTATLGGALPDTELSIVAGFYDALIMSALAIEGAGDSTNGPAIRDAFVGLSRPSGGDEQSVGPLDVAEALMYMRNDVPIDYQGALSDNDIQTDGVVRRPWLIMSMTVDAGTVSFTPLVSVL